jgi:pyruvate dehydrogenase E1 component
VVAGAYPPRRSSRPVVTLAAMGAVVPEVLAAAERLEALGSGPTSAA